MANEVDLQELPPAVREMAEAHERWEASQIALGMHCGACELFSDEDATGEGWCQFHDFTTECGKTCRHWTARSVRIRTP